MSEIKALVAAVATMTLDEVRKVWRERLGEPPSLRSTDLMRRALADRCSMKEYRIRWTSAWHNWPRDIARAPNPPW